MLGFVCKYAPVEVFEAMDTEVGRISPSVVNFNQADTLMHPNVCSFVKSVLEEVIGSDYEEQEHLYAELEHHMSTYTAELPLPPDYVSIACGIASYDPKTDLSVQDVVKRADDKMYRIKTAMKGEAPR
jgi:GGDEF domain-containing protein